jgi:hypothetical protein
MNELRERGFKKTENGSFQVPEVFVRTSFQQYHLKRHKILNNRRSKKLQALQKRKKSEIYQKID